MAEPAFDYKQDEASPPARASKAISWTASEYIDHQQGAGWYFGLMLATVVVAMVIYTLTRGVFGAIIILFLGLIVGLAARRKPQLAAYEISAKGLKVNDKFYSYSQFHSFSVIHENQLSSVVFEPLKRFMPPISAYFDVAEEDKIISFVGEHLPYQQKAPDPLDNLSRRLRF